LFFGLLGVIPVRRAAIGSFPPRTSRPPGTAAAGNSGRNSLHGATWSTHSPVDRPPGWGRSRHRELTLLVVRRCGRSGVAVGRVRRHGEDVL